MLPKTLDTQQTSILQSTTLASHDLNTHARMARLQLCVNISMHQHLQARVKGALGGIIGHSGKEVLSVCWGCIPLVMGVQVVKAYG